MAVYRAGAFTWKATGTIVTAGTCFLFVSSARPSAGTAAAACFASLKALTVLARKENLYSEILL